MRDAVVTTSASIIAAGIEIYMCHAWATGQIKYFKAEEFPITTLLWGVTITHWRVPHFWAIHRAMHPWFAKNHKGLIPDVGRFLYRYVHSLHHKSYNPTAFSGTNMHPVEAFM